MILPAPAAILFDFDGTLADTAPDMAFAANLLRKAHGLGTLPLECWRPHVSRGGRGMVWAGFGKTPEDPDFHALRDEFLAIYEANLYQHTRLFAGMDETLAALESRGIRWGIVTNKATRFTRPLMAAMGLDVRTPCIVSGDTTPHAKPHPAPLLHAATLLGVAPAECWYVGDDERDIIAAHAAGMVGIVADYGYLGGTPASTWRAEAHIAAPMDLIELHRVLLISSRKLVLDEND